MSIFQNLPDFLFEIVELYILLKMSIFQNLPDFLFEIVELYILLKKELKEQGVRK